MKNTLKQMMLFAAAALVALPSCEQMPEDEPEVVVPAENMVVSFTLGGSENIETRSGSFRDIESEMQPLGMEIEDAEEVALATSFRLNVEESALNEAFAENDAVQTKGTPVYTENMGDFSASVYEPSTSEGSDYSAKYFDDATFTKSGNTWSHDYGSVKAWPANGLRFFLRYPATEASSGWTYSYAAGKNKIRKVGFTTPGTGTGVTNAAELQTDFVFATECITKDDSKSTVGLLFYHPFCGVKFKLGDLPDGLVVKAIVLNGVYKTGDCTIIPYYGNGNKYDKSNSNADGATGTRSVDCVTWSNLSSPAQFTQTFGDTEQGTTPGSGFPTGFGGIAANQKQLNNENLSKTFILIPQTFTSDRKLSLTLMLEYNGISLSRNATMTAEWKAGSLYTYTIKFNSEIDVTITDTVDDNNVKKDVVITNTGNVPEYIRASIVGNWFLGSDIVAPWSNTAANGTFVGLPGSDWVKSGSYYYYTLPVAPEAHPAALFTTYTPVDTAPVAGAKLHMKVMVQAIIADDTVAYSAWGVKPSELN